MALHTFNLTMRNTNKRTIFHDSLITHGRQRLNFRFQRKRFEKISQIRQVREFDRKSKMFLRIEIQKVIYPRKDIRKSRPSKFMYREV
jgi:hypothetical protein